MVLDKCSTNKLCSTHACTIKQRAGASLVKIKPLFTYDSKYLLIASGCDVKAFSVSSGECVLTFKVHKHPIVSLRANPKNNLQILSCSEDGTVVRWDYSDGKALQKYRLGLQSKVVAFYAPSSCDLWFASCIIEETNFCKVYSLFMKKADSSQKVKLLSRVISAENGVALGPEGKYIAGVVDNSLLLYDMRNNACRRHKTGHVSLTCVAAHPKEYILATGDENGRLIVWSGMLESNHPIRSMYHWHSLPLPDLVFSPEGSHIYSAGGESVLLKWDLNSESKETLPRLGLPIHRLAVSPDNRLIAIAHSDNALQIINSNNVVVQAIQGLTQGHCQKFNSFETLPTGMLYDARSRAIVMNGRPGHLQFYNILEDKQLFHLDIVGQNFMCQVKENAIVNTDVTRAAIDSSGTWLATVEYRDDGETSPEIRLKFWQFDLTSQKFVLNTNIFLPHNKKINCLKFQPVSTDNSNNNCAPVAVTTSDDNRFKMWTLITNPKDKVKVSWCCELMGYYKQMPAGEVCFSEDGSLLCVSFDHVATLWTSDAVVLRTTLYHPRSVDTIRRIFFGQNECRHLLVYHTDSMLIVWDVLSLSVHWTVNCEIQYLVNDPLSDVMAAFTADRNAFIFKPSDPKPLSVLKNVSSEPVISAIFVPRVKTCWETSVNPCCWQQNSKLYFLNKKQELLAVDESEKDSEETEKLILKPSSEFTPFGLLQAEHCATGVTPYQVRKLAVDLTKDQPLELLCPTTIDPVTLCETMLPALLEAAIKRQPSAEIQPEETMYESKDAQMECCSHHHEVNFQTQSDSTTNVNFVALEDYDFLVDFVK